MNAASCDVQEERRAVANPYTQKPQLKLHRAFQVYPYLSNDEDGGDVCSVRRSWTGTIRTFPPR